MSGLPERVDPRCSFLYQGKIVKKLKRAFFQQEAEELARALIGTVLVHRVNGKEYRARIVETEAYVGTHDLACHASKGRTTSRTKR